jgi:FkbM family methyltransferase
MGTIEFNYSGRTYRFKTVSEDDLIHQEFLEFKTFLERPSLEAIRRRNLRGIYMDIGANLGGHSVYFSRECPSTKVLAFEGNPEMAELWKNNTSTNQAVPKAELHGHFVSCHRNLDFHRNPTNAGGSHVEASAQGKHQAKPLDDYANLAEPIVFIKIDVEGHELEVLKSGEKLLRKHRPELCIEILNADRSEVFAYLQSMGYAWYGEFSNSNHYFAPILGLFDKWIADMEKSKKKVLRSIGWRLRAIQAGQMGIISIAEAIGGAVTQKGLHEVVRKAFQKRQE